MKILVTYQSKTGFTQKYAEWIAEDLACVLLEATKVDQSEINKYDLVIHGGWIMGGMVNGLNKVRGLHPKRLIAFGVGFTAKEEVEIDKVKAANQLTDTPFYYFEGGMNPKKMGFLGRTMVKIVTKKTPVYADHTNRNEIEELVKLVKDFTIC